MGSKFSREERRPTQQEILTKFSDSLIQGPEFYKKGEEVADRVFVITKFHFKDVAVCIIGGGLGKHNAATEMEDGELYVYFRNMPRPPFRSILQEIVRLLNMAGKFYYIKRVSDTTLKFHYDKIRYHLTVGSNMGFPFSNEWLVQLTQLKAVEDPQVGGYLYGAAVCEHSIAFIRNQPAFEHAVIRLAKRWNAGIDHEELGWIPHRSLLIEVVAIQACREVGKRDILLAIQQFFKYMMDFNNLCIYFYDLAWVWSEMPKEMLEKKPVVLDPANPYHNLAARLTPRQAKAFRDSADISLYQLTACWWNYRSCANIF